MKYAANGIGVEGRDREEDQEKTITVKKRLRKRQIVRERE